MALTVFVAVGVLVAVNVFVAVWVAVGGVSEPATLVRNWLVAASDVWVAATAVLTAFGVFDGVALMVAEAAVVELEVTVKVFVIVAVFVNVAV